MLVKPSIYIFRIVYFKDFKKKPIIERIAIKFLSRHVT